MTKLRLALIKSFCLVLAQIRACEVADGLRVVAEGLDDGEGAEARLGLVKRLLHQVKVQIVLTVQDEVNAGRVQRRLPG